VYYIYKLEKNASILAKILYSVMLQNHSVS